MATSLNEYNAKRDFQRTREPAGKVARGTGDLFIVQKHDATRLHYDFRIEVDGVMKSWAVTRGPSPNPDDKRLAVQTEDHPMSYATFEGTIPAGEYGGGTVMLWDVGKWRPVPGKSAKDLQKGHLHFVLEGERMKGEWLLIRLKRRPGEKRDNWLLRKIEDDHAGGSDDLTARELTSVKTGRTMAEIASEAPETSLKGKRGKAFDAAMAAAERASPPRARLGEGDHAKHGGGGRRQASDLAAAPLHHALRARSPSPSKARGGMKLPLFRPPQLATLVDAVPAGNGWFHEIKFDGYRCLLAVAGDKVKVFTRSGLDWSDRFRQIADEAAGLGLSSCLIDGEIVALDAAGNPDFSTLQKALKGEGRAEMILFAFDLLEQEGKDLAKLPNIERKERLAALLGDGGAHIKVADHIVGAGEQLFQAMCKAGQEGVISKRADAAYSGRRSHAWLKVKCTRRQEFVIIGWTPSSASGRSIRNLLLAQKVDGKLSYAGKTGTGFNAGNVEALEQKLGKLTTSEPPVAVPRPDARGARWVKPKLVAEIAFAEFTADNVVRHASYLGLREDKKAEDVRIEEAERVPEPHHSDVTISNRDRLIFPEAKVTKGQLADYYEALGAAMLPWAANRPLSLVRCPQGRAKKCFFQKHDAGSFGDHVKKVPIREKDGGTEDYIYIDDIDGLVACVQMGTIEFHGWGSRADRVEYPDRMVFDLDPDIGLGWEDIVKAARHLRQVLADLGLVTFPMLSGGKGIHVIAPLDASADWATVTDFAKRFTQAIAAQDPDRYVATMSKAKRSGRIFIDWLRNQRGSTAILPYAVRARENAPVAVPVTWDEIETVKGAGVFTVKDAEALLERASSKALRGWGEAAQALPRH